MRAGRKYNDWYESNCKRTFHGFICIAITLVLFVFALLVSCKTLPPTLPTGTHDRDSIRTEYVHDSIYTDRWHTIYTKGDTVFVHDSIWRDRWHTKHDSVYINSTDTIYQTVTVEKQGGAFWKGSGIAFWVLLGILFIGLAVGITIKVAKR